MKKSIAAIVLGILCFPLFSQVVTTDPDFPFENGPVTIIFHSDRGDKGMINYSVDDVYAHTGVITDSSKSPSDWKYVKAGWEENKASCKLQKIAANEYHLTISPDIRSFYNVPSTEKILKMAFVFRNANGSKTGRNTGGADIFADVYEQELLVTFESPDKRFVFAEEGMTFPVVVKALEADSIILYHDEIRIAATTSSSIDTSLVASGFSRHQIVAEAYGNNERVADTVWYMVPGVAQNATLDAGLVDGINYISDDSVVFVLFAPGKQNIYLIGDFNNWIPDSSFQLARDGDRFWIALGNLIPEKEYAFQYLIDESLIIADPYSEKILDPDHDSGIPETVYPGLQDYPVGLTQGIAGVVHPGKPEFQWDDAGYQPPDAENLVIYELLIRDFVESHDIKDVKNKLDYLQTLGVNAIELMPFNEFEGNSSWGYNPSFFFAVDKYYGRDTDFKDFIQECHNRGIAVIMDIVLNHAYGQNSMVRMYYDAVNNQPAADNPWFNQQSPNPVFSWGFDFNHESEATTYFVDRVIDFWLTEYKIDGFRFDFTKGFTNTAGDGSAYDASRIAILKSIYDSMQTINPSAYMICEHFAPNTEEKVLSDYGILLWGNSNYNFNEATMGYLNNSDFAWASYKSRGWNNPYLVSYMESHDEERLMYKNITYGNSVAGYNIKETPVALKRMELAGVFLYAIPGPKMIWQFGELGYDVNIDFNGRVGEKPIRWEYLNDVNREHLYLIWAKMLDIRKNYAVFQTDDFTMTVGNMVALKKISLFHEDGDAIVVGNFGLTTETMQPGFTETGWWFETFSEDSLNVSDVNHSVTLAPGEYRVYTRIKMESIINNEDRYMPKRIGIYPNPATDKLYIESDRILESVIIYNVAGKPVKSVKNLDPSDSLDISALESGMYIIVIKEERELTTGKFMKQ